MGATEKYDVFVSHASEDKQEFVEPLVAELVECGLTVWYDDFSLDIGDSLRQSIDKGLAESRYGIVVLSRAFFAKQWPQRELDGLVQKAMGEGRKVVLPVWYGVTREDVAAYSLPLSDLLAANADEGPRAVAESIARVVRGGGGAEDSDSLDLSHRLAEQKLLASAKAMVADPTAVVGVRELADALARDARARLEALYLGALRTPLQETDLVPLFSEHRKILHTIVAFGALCANMGNPAHDPALERIVSMVAGKPGPEEGPQLPDGVWQYPAAFLMYAIGLSALQQKRLQLVRRILLDARQFSARDGDMVPLVDYISWGGISRLILGFCKPADGRVYHTPLSEHFMQELGPQVEPYFIDQREFENTFDIFEFTLGLADCVVELRRGQPPKRVPRGRYKWRVGRSRSGEGLAQLRTAVVEMGGMNILFDDNQGWFQDATTSIVSQQSAQSWL